MHLESEVKAKKKRETILKVIEDDEGGKMCDE